MKLFKNIGKTKPFYGYNHKGEKVEIIPALNQMGLVSKTVSYLLNNERGSTIEDIRYLICHLYNHNIYPNPKLFSLMRNADEEHQELIMDIIGISQFKYGQSCFLLIDELAPKIIGMLPRKSKSQRKKKVVKKIIKTKSLFY